MSPRLLVKPLRFLEKPVSLHSEGQLGRMVRSRWLVLLFLSLFAWERPELSAAKVAYSGKLTGAEANHDGSGYFRFSILDVKGTTIWSHSDDPASSVALGVANGVYSTVLGGDKMKPIPDSLWFDNRVVFLQVSFSGGLGKPFNEISPSRPILSFFPHSTSRIGNKKVVHLLGAFNPKTSPVQVQAALNHTIYFLPDQSAAASYKLKSYASLTQAEKEELEKIAWEGASEEAIWAIELLGGVEVIREQARQGSVAAQEILKKLNIPPLPDPVQKERKEMALLRAHVFSGRKPAFDQYGPLAGGLRKNENQHFNVVMLKEGKIVRHRDGEAITRKITFGEFDRLRRDAFLHQKPMSVQPATEFGKKIAMITKGSPTRRLRQNREEYWEKGKRWRWIGDRTGFAVEIEPPPE